MIAHVAGTVAEKFETSLIIDVGGVGYEVQVANGDFEAATLSSAIKLYTYHHIREQAQELYGFSSLATKRLFELLITVQGIGPKAALSILSVGAGEHVRSAIANGDVAYIQQAQGVGKRIAERVVVDLKDKVGLPGAVTYTLGGTALEQPAAAADDALDALVALGYTLAQATEALQTIEETDTSARVRKALQRLSS